MLNRRKTAGEYAKEVEESISAPAEQKVENDLVLIPTGSIMLNLACSDSISGGYGGGKIVNIIGDSSAGKSILALTGLAEMCYNPKFDRYKLIYDDAEQPREFNIEYLFGKTASDRIEFLDGDASETIEDFYGNVLRELDGQQPIVYVLDSFDSVTSEEEQKRSEEYKNNKKKSGSYKTEKPRMASEILRVIKGKVKDSSSLIIIISQTRDTIGFGAMFTPKSRSGGKALKFYCTHEIWLSVLAAEKSKDLVIGNWVGVKISKNKLTGKKRDVTFPIYYDYGVDDVTASVDFLLEMGTWKKVSADKKKGISAGVKNSLVDTCSKNRLIHTIETDDLKEALFQEVQKSWNEREESVKLDRTPRFGGS